MSTTKIQPVFVHSKLDDYGLNPSQFRVYCHLARRAGSGASYAAVSSMAKITRLHEDTVRTCLKDLEGLSMIQKTERYGQTSIYTLLDVSKWANPPENRGGATTRKRREGSPPKIGETHPPENRGDKGNPTEGYPQKEKEPFSFSRSLGGEQKRKTGKVTIPVDASWEKGRR